MRYLNGVESRFETNGKHYVRTVRGLMLEIDDKVETALQMALNNHSLDELADETISLLLEKGLIYEKGHLPKKVTASYSGVWYSRDIEPTEAIRFGVKAISNLFHRWMFFGLIIAVSVVHIGIIVTIFSSAGAYSGWLTMPPLKWVYLFGLVVFSQILHEFGHAGAIYHYTKGVPPIGIGIMAMFPVLYTDVSASNALTVKSRTIVMLAGVYIQLLFSAMLVLLYGISSALINIFAIITCVRVLKDLAPVFRSDGYWILQDWAKDISTLAKKQFVSKIISSITLAPLFFLAVWLLLIRNPAIIIEIINGTQDYPLQSGILIALQYMAAIGYFGYLLLRLRPQKDRLI